jgi:hypothetical protein
MRGETMAAGAPMVAEKKSAASISPRAQTQWVSAVLEDTPESSACLDCCRHSLFALPSSRTARYLTQVVRPRDQVCVSVAATCTTAVHRKRVARPRNFVPKSRW